MGDFMSEVEEKYLEYLKECFDVEITSDIELDDRAEEYKIITDNYRNQVLVDSHNNPVKFRFKVYSSKIVSSKDETPAGSISGFSIREFYPLEKGGFVLNVKLNITDKYFRVYIDSDGNMMSATELVKGVLSYSDIGDSYYFPRDYGDYLGYYSPIFGELVDTKFKSLSALYDGYGIGVIEGDSVPRLIGEDGSIRKIFYNNPQVIGSNRIICENNGRRFLLDTNLNIISEVNKDYIISRSKNGYFIVKNNEDGTYNFMDASGKLISDIWFEKVEDFSRGRALVKTADGYNFIDTDGILLLDEYLSEAYSFEGLKTVVRKKDFTYGLMDRTGNIEEYSGLTIKPFVEGKAIVSRQTGRGLKSNIEYNYLDYDGNLLLELWADKVYPFKDGITTVKYYDKKTSTDFSRKIIVIDLEGDPIYDIERYSEEFRSHNFKDKEEVRGFTTRKKKEPLECEVVGLLKKKYLYGDVELAQRPIVNYDGAVFCFSRGLIYKYDLITGTIEPLCRLNDFKFGDNYISIKDRNYFVRNGELIDITDIGYAEGIRLVTPERILSFSEFQSIYSNDPNHEEVIERAKAIKQEYKLNHDKKLAHRDATRKSEVTEEEREEAIRAINEAKEKIVAIYLSLQHAFAILDMLDPKVMVTLPGRNLLPITSDILFIKVDDHLEIDPRFKESHMLRHFDLSGIDFSGVKLSGEECLSYTNADINPQTVYKKDLSFCDLRGIYNTLDDFSGVKVEGTIFDEEKLDFVNTLKPGSGFVINLKTYPSNLTPDEVRSMTFVETPKSQPGGIVLESTGKKR